MIIGYDAELRVHRFRRLSGILGCVRDLSFSNLALVSDEVLVERLDGADG
jgi:hypothetical protein